MNIKELILKQLKAQKSIKVSDIVKKTHFSRAYINRFFQELRNEGKIILIGKANKAYYILAEKKALEQAKRKITVINKRLVNKNLLEDQVFDQIVKETGILTDLNKNLFDIINYAFTEMFNNAIEHSKSKIIEYKMENTNNSIKFTIRDYGIGIFKNIMSKKNLKNELEAIQDLLKGKQTTAAEKHSGEGIFFTSKCADNFVITSFSKKLIFNNIINDIFISDIKSIKGTKIIFTLAVKTKKDLSKIFKEYSGLDFEFSKTKIYVKLYKTGTSFISRSQARRILAGLEKFKTIVLDFKNINTVGQGFTDEIFRIWPKYHPKIKIDTINTNENIDFMIKRAI
jgi:anti-sigma regulatory factor (Ser/Thr protein kinase)